MIRYIIVMLTTRCHSNISEMDTICECKETVVQQLVKTPKPFKNLEAVVVDFGKVAVYGKYVKFITIETVKKSVTCSYRITRDPHVNSIYRVFNFGKYEGFSKTDKDFKLKITYTPLVPFQKDVDNFEFLDSSFNIINIVTRGESVGPQLSVSVRQLNFFITPSDHLNNKQTFAIRNLSETPADFVFDCNTQDLFQIEPKHGHVRGHKDLYVDVVFSPKSRGYFSRSLYCLIHGQEPLVVDLFGSYSKKNIHPETIKLETYLFPFKETVGYGAYLRDSTVVKSTVPPISFSKTYIDFGRCLKEDKSGSVVAQTTSLTNHTSKDIELKWLEDNDIFRVSPKKAKIQPDNSALFELSFYPKDSCKLYYKSLLAQVYWNSCDHAEQTIRIPLVATIIVQGHSFPEGDCLIPNIEIEPSELIFPCCLPEAVTNGNFKISNIGHIPIAYKLIPPKKT